MVEFLQVVLLIIGIALSLAGPSFGSPNLIRRLRSFSSNQQIVLVCAGGSAFFGCLVVSILLHEPVPRIHDEFSYLLMADTFSHGDIANPSPPLTEFFDSFHVLVHPVYASKYFPAQGLFLAIGQVLTGHPAVGVWLSSALACAATCWMLQSWIGPVWGLLGGFLIAVQIGVYSYWSQSYWGGMVAALGGALFFIGCSPRGKKLAIMKAQVVQQAFVPLPGKTKAEYLSWGLSHYRHPDWLGSSRLESSTTHAIIQDTAYDPFGVPYAELSGGNGEISFTGQNKDTAWLQYDFLDRQYDPKQGRWLSPDPMGLAAADPASPQSWNRYAYVQNNPLAMVDPFGDDGCYDPQGNSVSGVSNSADCAAQNSGNTWVNDCPNCLITVPSQPGCANGACDGSAPSNPSAPANPFDNPQVTIAIGAANNSGWGVIADVAGVGAAVLQNQRMTVGSMILSIANDRSPQNVLWNTVSVLAPYAIEGSDVPLAFGFAVYDGSQFAGQVLGNVFTPDALQSDTIQNGNGVTIQSPGAVDWCQVAGCN